MELIHGPDHGVWSSWSSVWARRVKLPMNSPFRLLRTGRNPLNLPLFFKLFYKFL